MPAFDDGLFISIGEGMVDGIVPDEEAGQKSGKAGSSLSYLDQRVTINARIRIIFLIHI